MVSHRLHYVVQSLTHRQQSMRCKVAGLRGGRRGHRSRLSRIADIEAYHSQLAKFRVPARADSQLTFGVIVVGLIRIIRQQERRMHRILIQTPVTATPDAER